MSKAAVDPPQGGGSKFELFANGHFPATIAQSAVRYKAASTLVFPSELGIPSKVEQSADRRKTTSYLYAFFL